MISTSFSELLFSKKSALVISVATLEMSIGNDNFLRNCSAVAVHFFVLMSWRSWDFLKDQSIVRLSARLFFGQFRSITMLLAFKFYLFLWTKGENKSTNHDNS